MKEEKMGAGSLYPDEKTGNTSPETRTDGLGSTVQTGAGDGTTESGNGTLNEPRTPPKGPAYPMTHPFNTGQPQASEKSWAPGRKFLAAGTGLGLGGNIAIIVAYHFPDMPATVTAAYGGIVMYFVTLLVTYLVPSE